jgi:hypothetical protein
MHSTKHKGNNNKQWRYFGPVSLGLSFLEYVMRPIELFFVGKTRQPQLSPNRASQPIESNNFILSIKK